MSEGDGRAHYALVSAGGLPLCGLTSHEQCRESRGPSWLSELELAFE